LAPEVAGITITVPGLLRDCIGGAASAPLEADTAAEAVAVMLDTFPRLKVHLYDEDGRMRDHVFLALNGSSVKRRADLDVPLRDGDRLAVVQAVSGG
jgi:molybdopterin converting factor small subunit